MQATRHCPHCHKPIALRVRTQVAVSIEKTAATLTQRPMKSLEERLSTQLQRAGRFGATVRQLQQALKGPRAGEIADVLWRWMTEVPPRVIDEQRGRAMYYRWIAAESGESEAPSVTPGNDVSQE